MDSEANSKKEPAQQLLFPELVSNYQEGRDELNLAEFPISAIGNRFDPSVKTILFQDVAFDKASGETIRRKLTITASDQYGLPTAPDDEILLGLLQLSRIQNFEARSFQNRYMRLSYGRFAIHRGNLIGSAASFVDAKLWCEKRFGHGN